MTWRTWRRTAKPYGSSRLRDFFEDDRCSGYGAVLQYLMSEIRCDGLLTLFTKLKICGPHPPCALLILPADFDLRQERSNWATLHVNPTTPVRRLLWLKG